MQGDFSRDTFRPEQGYSSVRLQQGRVSVDADWNEQADIHDYLERTALTDVIGSAGTPEPGGFGITIAGDGSVRVGAGRYYVQGILAENDAERILPDQPFLPGTTLPTDPGLYYAYLDVQERLVTHLHDPLLREVALDGPDTAARKQVIWQVRLERSGDIGDPLTCANFETGWLPAGAASTGRLRARAETPAPDANECLVPPGAGYRRQENQFYRVEIHDPGAPGAATFKWSRENGSVLARLTGVGGDVLSIDPPGRDAVLGWAPGNWVELSDEGRALRGEPGVLVKLGPVDGDRLTVADWGSGGALTMASFGNLPTVRRWDSEGALPLTAAGTFLALEGGVEIEFDPDPAQNAYVTGDYWSFPARTATGAVEWPLDGAGDPVFVARHGITHGYASLALLQFDGTAWTLLSDCRNIFPPLTGLLTLLHAGGDGQESLPGEPLRRSLRVAAFRGRFPVANVRILFTAAGAGRVADAEANLPAAGSTFETVTDADGLAACFWQLENDLAQPVQTLEARLLDSGGTPQPAAIYFVGSLSLARGVFYESDPACANLAGLSTVQEAMNRISHIASLYPRSGDGQHLTPGEAAAPLQVVVSSPCGPVTGAIVRFTVTAGAGTLAGGPGPVDVTTDADGLASVDWQPDTATPNQLVEATLAGGFESATPPLTAQFATSLNLGGGGGVACSVTVGPGGQFPTLTDAIAALVRAGAAPDVSICLLAGDHALDSGLDLVAPDDRPWHIAIDGSGRGTRILLRRQPLRTRRLASLALRHLDLRADEVDRPIRISEVQEFTLEDCHLEQSSLPTVLVTIEGVQRAFFSASTLSSHFPVLERLLGGITPLNIREILQAEQDPSKRVNLLAARLFEIDKQVANDAIGRIAEFGLGQQGIDDLTRREYRELTTRMQREIISAQPQASRDERLRATLAAVEFLSRLLFADALAFADPRADTTLDNCSLLGRVYLYGTKQQGIPVDQFREQGRRIVAGGVDLGPFLGEFRALSCRILNIRIDQAALSQIQSQEHWRNLYRSCHLAGNEFIGGSVNMLLASHVVLDANRFAAAASGEPAVLSICETATLTGNSGPSKATLMTAVRNGLTSGSVQQAANHLQVTNP